MVINVYFRRKIAERYLPYIHGMLILALLVQMLLPLHFHMHHDAVPDIYEHKIHAHTSMDYHTDTVSESGVIHEIKSMPDTLVKQIKDTGTASALFICLIFLLPVISAVVRSYWPALNNQLFHYYYYSLSPPLRAPPTL